MLRVLAYIRNEPPLRLFGTIAMTAIVVVTAFSDPRPGLHGDGPPAALAIAALIAGILLSVPRVDMPARRRIAGLLLVSAATWALSAMQPVGVILGALYYVVVISALRLELVPALIVSGVAVAGECVVIGLTAESPAGGIVGTAFSVIPWFLVIRLLRQMFQGREQAEQLVEELRESRAAHAESAALAERGRVARDMHDVLAHSLSALALQLEGARLLAQDRGSDPDVIAAVERAHHLAAEGLSEARDAIGALRGEELPGPERLQHLADGYAGDCRVTVNGSPRELGSEARLAVYRTAQEALTNVLRHSAADRVEIVLTYEDGGTRLVIQDHGPGAPVAVGPGTPGGGYGLTGMRERAELLGGRLSAEPTADGFRVELWLPA
jgi:signal transduction histidine kinase